MVDPKLLKLWVLSNTKDNGIRTYKPKTSMPETGQEMIEGFELKARWNLHSVLEFRRRQNSELHRQI